MVLVLDDLHWADTSTTLLLAHLLADGEPARQLVLGTIRDADGHRSEELTDLLARLSRDPAYERLDLRGLDDEETHALVDTQGAGDISESFVLRLHESTDGNPFFIKETLRSLAGGASGTLTAGVPEGVKDLIGTRLARLTETANQVLSVASVIGREFDLEVLEALVDEPEERIISALEEAADAALVAEVEDDVDRFVFSHALVRETLYERQGTSRRVRVHHRIARGAGGRSAAPTPAEVAHHYFESRHLDREGKAVEFSVRAGDEASAAFAYEEAAAHYRHALERLAAGDDERRCRAAARARRRGVARRRGERARRSCGRGARPRARAGRGARPRRARPHDGVRRGGRDRHRGHRAARGRRSTRSSTTTRSPRSCRRGWPTSCTSRARASASRR